jgi:RNA polymerase sigma-70 factor (ECF subfamily)
MDLKSVFERFERFAASPGAPLDWRGGARAVSGSVPLPGTPGLAGALGPAISAEEAALVARARAGDQDAFAVLVRQHQRQVYALALRMLRDEEEAVEATQEAFLAAWQHLPQFRGEARVATWLYRITYRHCLKVAEQRRRDAQTRAELAGVSARDEQPAAQMSRYHAQHAVDDLSELVRDEISKLPPKYGAALALRHLQDLSYEEMAAVMRMPIGTVKTHLFRARALLKARLTELDRATSEGRNRAGEWSAGLREFIGRRLDGLRKERDA